MKAFHNEAGNVGILVEGSSLGCDVISIVIPTGYYPGLEIGDM